MLRKIARLIPAQLCFILHHLSWWKLLFAVGNFQVILKPWCTDALYIHPSFLCWLRISSMCLCLFVVQEMEERIQHFDTFLWDGENTYQVDPEQPGTTKTHTNLSEREVKERPSPTLNTQTHNHTQKIQRPPPAGREHNEGEVEDRDIQWCYRLRNLARSRPILHNQTPGGVSVTHTHTRTHTNGDGQPWCYSGANFYPCCSWDYFLTWTTSKTNRQIGWCHITTWPFFVFFSSVERPVHTHLHTHPSPRPPPTTLWVCMYF